MDFIQQLYNAAQGTCRRIVLPETDDERVLKAACLVQQKNLAKVLLLGETGVLKQKFQKLKLESSGIEFISLAENKEVYADLMLEIRKGKNLLKNEALKLLENPIYYGCLMVKSGAADGMVAGAAHSTADILKPALKYIKTAQNTSLVSGFFLAVLPFPQKTAENKNFSPILGLADCAVNPNPNPQQLAEIAINSAATMKKLTNTEPKVAMLSFSTRGSATHQMVEKVTEATKIAQQLAPDLKLDGEMQLDAALIEEVAQSKSPQSSVAGKANVLIFPDLNSGNIGYKLIQRLGMAQVIGPILQGMAAPVNDLSRGCTVEEIVNLVAITSLQS